MHISYLRSYLIRCNDIQTCKVRYFKLNADGSPHMNVKPDTTNTDEIRLTLLAMFSKD